MNVQQFRRKIRAGTSIMVEGREFEVLQVVLFRFDDKDFYIKCFLSDEYVIADDAHNNSFVLVHKIDCDIAQPFPEELEYDGKEFTFLFEAHAIAEEATGEEIFPKGNSETFWDYESDDGAYLSIGINDQSGEREDYYGKTVHDIEFPEL